MENGKEVAGPAGFPELTELGKRIEMFRIQRGLSKQFLARHAGTSRQQLWRVMTGKSELTSPLKSRLAEALRVPTAELDPSMGSRRAASTTTRTLGPTAPLHLPAYLAEPETISRTLTSMPSGDAGRSLKRRFLDALEDMAIENRCALDTSFFELRRRVIAGEL
jgi:transcriptional regulator with XRE-family HTH domain